MWELRAIDVQIISKGMEIQRLEQELKENRDRWTNKELDDAHRKMRKIRLKSALREYKNLLKRWWLVEEYWRYQEQVAEMRREEEILRRDDLYDNDYEND